MGQSEVFSTVVFTLGPVAVSDTVVTTWGIMVLLALSGWLISRRLQTQPKKIQVIAEGIVSAVENAIEGAMPQYSKTVVPFIMALWIFLIGQPCRFDSRAAFTYTRLVAHRRTGVIGVLVGALVWYPYPRLEAVLATLPYSQPDIVAVSYH